MSCTVILEKVESLGRGVFQLLPHVKREEKHDGRNWQRKLLLTRKGNLVMELCRLEGVVPSSIDDAVRLWDSKRRLMDKIDDMDRRLEAVGVVNH